MYWWNNCRLIAVDFSKKNSLDAYSRAIQQIVFQGVVRGADNKKIRQYTILEKSKIILEFYKGAAKFLCEYINGWVNVKSSDSQLNKLKTAVKNRQDLTLMNFKMFNWINLLYELLLTTRQKTKLRNAIENKFIIK